MEKKMGKKVEIKIVAEEAVQQGIYANMARISHSPEEIIIDFIYVHHGPPFGKLRSRIIMNPKHAKRLLMALNQNIQNYEANWGEISLPKPPEAPEIIQ